MLVLAKAPNMTLDLVLKSNFLFLKFSNKTKIEIFTIDRG
jgi:hypothetical protein